MIKKFPPLDLEKCDCEHFLLSEYYYQKVGVLDCKDYLSWRENYLKEHFKVLSAVKSQGHGEKPM